STSRCLRLGIFLFLLPAPTAPATLSLTTLFRSGRHRRAGHAVRSAGPAGAAGAGAGGARHGRPAAGTAAALPEARRAGANRCRRSEEHTSELQSRENLVCRLLLEKKKPED